MYKPREFAVNPDHNFCIERGGQAKIGMSGEQQMLPMIHVIEMGAYRELEQKLFRETDIAMNMDAKYCVQLNRIEKLRAALAFYADEENWSECTDQATSHMIGPDDHSAIIPFGKKFKAGLHAYRALAADDKAKGGA